MRSLMLSPNDKLTRAEAKRVKELHGGDRIRYARDMCDGKTVWVHVGNRCVGTVGQVRKALESRAVKVKGEP